MGYNNSVLHDSECKVNSSVNMNNYLFVKDIVKFILAKKGICYECFMKHFNFSELDLANMFVYSCDEDEFFFELTINLLLTNNYDLEDINQNKCFKRKYFQNLPLLAEYNNEILENTEMLDSMTLIDFDTYASMQAKLFAMEMAYQDITRGTSSAYINERK